MLDIYTYSKRVVITAAIVLLVGAAFYMLGTHGHFFLLVFAAILLATLFCSIADWLVRVLRSGWGLSVLLAVVLVFGFLVASFYFLAPTVSRQIQEMRDTAPEAIARVQDWLATFGLGQTVLQSVPDDVSNVLPEKKSLLSNISQIFSVTLSILADFLIVIVTAIFFAISPKVYTVGFTKLFAVRYRSRIMEVLGKCYDTLQKWLLAMLLAMAIIGISTAIAFNLFGMPMAFISFLFAFVPNIGPWIAAVPIGLVGLTAGPQVVMYALLIYGGIQFIESYAITPLIFQKTVDLPPALLLFFQVILGILEGGLGLFLAAPLLAVLMVVINELYIKDLIEKKPLDASEEKVS
ncbi:AI-2E family transporter [Pontibacter oryzae]|uniref:AI-2E family transporter n=1 Tax=Pontibacter oryzae TaxID=2304593 RepID=A0A399SH92_9BACT|nr:AI-2E family transporter [Pontibacter oryzae]RIJ42471.1 AI-2E family transporter [Pontibacter oryzae]